MTRGKKTMSQTMIGTGYGPIDQVAVLQFLPSSDITGTSKLHNLMKYDKIRKFLVVRCNTQIWPPNKIEEWTSTTQKIDIGTVHPILRI